MGRVILGAVVGYVVMAAFVFVTFSLAYLVLGTEGSFQSGSFEASPLWLAASIALGLAGALLGGLAAARVGKSRASGIALAGVVLVLGAVMAYLTLSHEGPEPGARTGEVAMTDAMQKVKEPAWFLIVNPLIGMAGVVVGSRCTGAKKADR